MCSWIYRPELSGKAQAVVVVPVVGVVIVAVSHPAVPRIVVPTTTTENAVRAFLLRMYPSVFRY